MSQRHDYEDAIEGFIVMWVNTTPGNRSNNKHASPASPRECRNAGTTIPMRHGFFMFPCVCERRHSNPLQRHFRCQRHIYKLWGRRRQYLLICRIPLSENPKMFRVRQTNNVSLQNLLLRVHSIRDTEQFYLKLAVQCKPKLLSSKAPNTSACPWTF